ncbi:hypothetical protein BRARA_C03095 [Brassica rapa]|nr:F-box/kelch-repeat protein At3g16740 [Brassica rapa]XP_013681505.3 F-box/kelch-repeat protein At3g16740-like [Brassica napus]RID71140.1 hypothetical protein BRARA_C03095 [Brassica rapa]CAG7882069.1 unnamed protein product [Brassica rapa]CDY71000.1 BnaAnng35760D [Brassica napus]VDC81361.1 unnamed protein product [Brassica rapa]
MSDLPREMEEEVLSRLPVTSLIDLRSTCKTWNTLTKRESFLNRHVFEEEEAAPAKKKKRRKVVMMQEHRVYLMNVDLLYPSIERIGNLDADGIDISNIFHCDGLFLCTTKDTRLVVWNPYLGQTRWIEPRTSYHRWDRYALGHEKKKRHKVLRFVNNYDPSVKHRVCEFEIFSLDSNSWRVIDDDLTPDWTVSFLHRGLSLKGNTYWYAQEKLDLNGPPEIKELPDFLLCFDFTTERFGPRLPLPFNAFFGDIVTLSSVGEEQLALLLQRCTSPAFTVNIWITSKIEPNACSWRNVFLSVDMKPLIGTLFSVFGGSFFVDEEKKVAVVLDKDRGKSCPPTRNIACIIGNNGYFKQVDLGESIGKWCYSIVCPYVPSSLQITRQLEEHTP